MATAPRSFVVMDTNVYRRLGHGKTVEQARRKGEGLATHNARLGIQALAHPSASLRRIVRN